MDVPRSYRGRTYPAPRLTPLAAAMLALCVAVPGGGLVALLAAALGAV